MSICSSCDFRCFFVFLRQIHTMTTMAMMMRTTAATMIAPIIPPENLIGVVFFVVGVIFFVVLYARVSRRASALIGIMIERRERMKSVILRAMVRMVEDYRNDHNFYERRQKSLVRNVTKRVIGVVKYQLDSTPLNTTACMPN